ncbi:nucleoside hydrolase [Natrinema gelatinilyticum]|uniref:nucleoside hydrolase n=1 Tax=Natrinema gelatinilyticum TaxID=2961571 RepID=UPI0020C30833|nr:nucleoside hydrolase [Natrinema gelatinilyticum]
MTTKLLIDTDPGCDDAVAIAAALAHPDLEVVGLSTVAGNTTLENTTRNAHAILELLDRTNFPVARGCDRPISRELVSAEDVHGPGGIRGDLPEPTAEPIDAHGAAFIVDQAREYGDDLTIAAVGPWTNLATAMLLEPALPDMVANIYLMGGAAMTGGNVTPEAEFNVYVDPEAASHVVQHARPKMGGLDVTNRSTVAAELIEDYADRDAPFDTIAAWFGYEDADAVRERGIEDPPSVHDAAVVIDIVEDIFEYETYPVEVNTGHGPSRGATICDTRGTTGEEQTVDVAVDVDLEAFRTTLAETLENL